MSEVRVLVAFAVFVVYALLLAERGIHTAVAPFCAIAGAALVATAFGCFGVLALGGWVLYLGALAAVGWLVFRWGVQRRARPAFSAGFWLFVAAGLWVIAMFWLKQPMFTTWDEFSFWGTAAKLTQTYGEFYTTAPVGWPWPATYPPFLTSLAYFVQFWGSGQGAGSVFLEWQLYVAYDLLALSVLAAMLAPFGRRSWNIALPVALIGFLTPFVFIHYGAVSKLSAVYLDSLSDASMGFLFGGALVLYFVGRGKGARGMVPACLALVALTLTKDTGFALALVAAVLMLLDMLLAKRPAGKVQPAGRGAAGAEGVAKAAFDGENVPVPDAESSSLPDAADAPMAGKGAAEGSVPVTSSAPATAGRPKAVRRWPASLARFAVFAACVVVPFLLWALYLQMASSVDRFQLGGVDNVGMAQLPALFLKELFSAEKSARFTAVMSEAPSILATARTTMLGPCLFAVAAILLVVAGAAVVTKDPAHRRRCVAFGVGSALGFAAYLLLILLTYMYIFPIENRFSSFERYLYPYLIGWFLAAVLLLAFSAKASRLVVAGKAALLALCALLCLRVWQFVPIGYSVLGFHADEYAARRAFSAEAAALAEELPPDCMVFIVSQDDNGVKWFTYCYELLPRQVDYSYGGGVLAPPGALPEDTLYYHAVTLAEWQQYLMDHGVTHVYLDATDPLFVQSYGVLFSDGMQAYENGETALYAVQVTDGEVVLTPVLPAAKVTSAVP